VGHYRVEAEGGKLSAATPVLVEATREVYPEVLERFERESARVDAGIVTLVRGGIERYLRR
jgi:hypothetical protein